MPAYTARQTLLCTEIKVFTEIPVFTDLLHTEMYMEITDLLEISDYMEEVLREILRQGMNVGVRPHMIRKRCPYCDCKQLSEFRFQGEPVRDRLYCLACFRFTYANGKPRPQLTAAR